MTKIKHLRRRISPKDISLNVSMAMPWRSCGTRTCAEGSARTYADGSVPVGKGGLLHALSVGDIPHTHLPSRDNLVLFSVISTQLAGIIFVPLSFFFSAALKCGLIVYGAFCYRLLGKRMPWSLAGMTHCIGVFLSG